jgi:hypothetical protein
LEKSGDFEMIMPWETIGPPDCWDVCTPYIPQWYDSPFMLYIMIFLLGLVTGYIIYRFVEIIMGQVGMP